MLGYGMFVSVVGGHATQSYHIISYHIMSNHIISYHIIYIYMFVLVATN